VGPDNTQDLLVLKQKTEGRNQFSETVMDTLKGREKMKVKKSSDAEGSNSGS